MEEMKKVVEERKELREILENDYDWERVYANMGRRREEVGEEEGER